MYECFNLSNFKLTKGNFSTRLIINAESIENADSILTQRKYFAENLYDLYEILQ